MIQYPAGTTLQKERKDEADCESRSRQVRSGHQTWKTLAPIPTAGRAIGAVIGGNLFVMVQGSSGERRSYDYTPGTNVWRRRAASKWTYDGVDQVTRDGTNHLAAVGDADRLQDCRCQPLPASTPVW